MMYVLLFFTLLIDVMAAVFMASSYFGKWTLFLAVFLYGLSFYCRLIILKALPLGIVFALGSGISICLSVLVGFVLFKQVIDLPAYVGIVFILCGVAVMCNLSKVV